jgi:uncharacterized RDD family membrane protein YckC
MRESTSFQVASSNRRVGAFVIDDMVVSLLFIIIFYEHLTTLFSHFTVIDEVALEQMNIFISENILAVLLIKLIYHTVFVWQNGMTLGKYMMKIKVVDMQTHIKPNLQRSFLRASVRIPSELLLYLGFLMAFFVPLRQTLHDKLSGCVVIDV